MKIITIVGARPQIIKAAAFSRAISLKFPEIEEVIVHTGQHYDDNMSEVFFKELGIPNPAINLHVGSSSHGNQTALMIQKIEEILLKENPNAVLVYGDTNSTLATAIAASKIHVPIVHVLRFGVSQKKYFRNGVAVFLPCFQTLLQNIRKPKSPKWSNTEKSEISSIL